MTDGNSGHRRRPSWYSGGNTVDHGNRLSRAEPRSEAGSPEAIEWRERSDAASPPGHGNPSGDRYHSAPGMEHSRPASQVGGYGVGPGYTPHHSHAGGGYFHGGYPPTGYAPAGYRYYSPTPGTDALQEMQFQREEKARGHHTAAIVLAIIGFFTLPILLGPLAIWQASKARNLGHPGVAGMVLGWIVVVWAFTGWFFGFVMMFLVGIVAAAGGG
ncbi:DUF4870 domain-containing protein [Nesterenkonia ebinurensis]|uniref:DUF4870 domain-containing protein n=1 Tax=Nesterenkonia ebinurensis TaxID=2608252 RepID=UPI00123DCA8B|nr:DUF4870 domain-containing protein [Nesterenkonia ebinurensis]